MDINEIAAVLPHRYPFLLVDRVLEVSDTQIKTLKNVTMNEPFFPGHFPSKPVMPGVLIIEAMAQSGALLACQTAEFDASKDVVYFMGIDKAKFRRPVVPGDQLTMTCDVLRGGKKVWKFRGEARVDGELAAEAELLATVGKSA